ncbi:hypothetical protein GOODEAATRI_026001 [Goodea atripinnis]|uniref:Uncharacterized protein n=1 Tax=Goodea atripinnis TaxID=208336 RepID=A0ABV0MKU1_9TELE
MERNIVEGWPPADDPVFVFVCKNDIFYSVSIQPLLHLYLPSTNRCLIPITIGPFFMSVKAGWAGLKQSTRARNAVDCAPRQPKSSAGRCKETGTFILLPAEHSYQRLRSIADFFQSSSN